MTNFVNLAEQLIKSNDQQVYTFMYNAICDPNNLQTILSQIYNSDALLFIFTEMLTKSAVNGEFCPINQTKSDDNSMKENLNEKSKMYPIIIPRLFEGIIIKDFTSKKYIRRSAVNAIAACLKDLCDNNRNLQQFNNILTQTLFPSFRLNEQFTSSLQNELIFLNPSSSIINFLMTNQKGLEIYKQSQLILIQLIEYITMVTVYKSYYEYRRNIYTFRNVYLSSILNITAQFHKTLHYEWKKSPQSQLLIDSMVTSIHLLEKIITYPFSLTLHQYQSDDQTRDNIIGINSEVYFPTFYRNILCDQSFLEMIFQFYTFILKQVSQIHQIGDTIYSLIRILGKIMSASVYSFNSDEERKQFRGFCTSVALQMLQQFKFYDSFYIQCLCDIFSKVLNSYSNADLQDRKQNLFEGILLFCENLIQNCQIKLQDGKRNPFNRAFNLLALCVSESKEYHHQAQIKDKCQQILNKAFARMHNWQQADAIMNEFGHHRKYEIECFEELFSHIPPIFSINLDQNLITLRNLEIEKFNQNLQTIWLHLCSLLLPSHHANDQQTTIIIKYFKVAQNGNSMACLHYIKTLINQVLFEMENGLPTTSLWSWIHQLEKCSFKDFMLHIIKLCKQKFKNQNTEIIDYALEVFKQIYSKLRKFRNDKFDAFYEEVKDLLTRLSQTIFDNPKYFKRREYLFSTISSIWINDDNYKYLNEIYSLISQNLKINVNATNFLKYMHDITGALEPIESSECFHIFSQLALLDLQQVLPIILNQQNLVQLFSDQNFLKIFCKMVLNFTTDYTKRITYHVQTDLPFKIYDTFLPYVSQILNFDYPKQALSIWIKFSSLNPIEQLLPLKNLINQKSHKQYSSLARQYFENIHRVPQDILQSLYPCIEDKVEYLINWWEQIVRRKLLPQVSLKEAVQSRIGNTKRQKEELAKLIYHVGSYNECYWKVSQFSDERQFIAWFMNNYKDFKDY